MKKKVLCLMGATAVGKTALACSLYDRYPVRLISVDATQIYQHLNIGSGKPSAAFLRRYPHALIDILPPEGNYSAAQFCDDARYHIEQAHEKGELPVLVGGTMLYYHALFSGLADLPSADALIRANLLQRLNDEGCEVLHQELCEIDPVVAQKISVNDPQRLMRLHELYQLTGEPPSALYAKQKPIANDWDTLSIALHLPRATLHQRIAERFHQMMADGFLEEVRALKMRETLTAEHSSMRSIGYRQLWQHLAGENRLDEAVELAIIATRQLAKRQLTWLRNRLSRATTITHYQTGEHAALLHIDRFLNDE